MPGNAVFTSNMMSQTRRDAATFHIDQRLSFGGLRCTVRYIGGVKSTKGEWLGVEWDDSSRGKHNGSAYGESYFKCKSSSETAGSFVRPTRQVDKVQSFVSAVRQKYASEATERLDALNLKKEIEISGKVVEEVGFDKIRQQLAQLHELKIVLVDGLRVDKAITETEKIKEVCPKIIELDLSRNLFEDCAEIEIICGNLKQLKSLRLNGNRLKVDPTHLPPYLLEPPDRTAFSKITELGLDEMLLQWSEVWTFLEAFPSIKKLSASGNELSSLTLTTLSRPSAILTLTSLTLEYNSFSSLADLEGIIGLVALEKLHLKGNRIKSLASSRSASRLEFGKRLHYVDLSYNNVLDWDFVNKLPEVFPGLTSLRFSHNPIYEIQEGNKAISNDENYMLTLARLKNLKSLNYSNITPAERSNAEMFYLSRIGKAMAAVPIERETEATFQHPRYVELCELYGPPPVVRADTSIHPDWLDARLIKFTFTMPAHTLKGQDAPYTRIKEIPNGFDMYQVKGVVGAFWNIPPLELRLFWETGQWDPVAGYEDEEEESSDEEMKGGALRAEVEKSRIKGKWMKREVELEESTRQVGFSVDEKEATVRVELRHTYCPPYE